MRVVPAIDLLGGRCVRLLQGDYERRLDYEADPLALARQYAGQGARLLHVVDLDGARDGARANREVAGLLAAGAGVEVEIGGGMRSPEDVADALAAGAAFAVVGTAVAERPELLASLVARFGERVVLGLDVRDGRVAVRGWRESASITPVELGCAAAAAGVRRAVFTDVGRDGMLHGPDLEGAIALAAATGLAVTASGGVGSLEHVRAAARAGVDSLIVGRALVEGRFTVAQAIDAAGEVG